MSYSCLKRTDKSLNGVQVKFTLFLARNLDNINADLSAQRENEDEKV